MGSFKQIRLFFKNVETDEVRYVSWFQFREPFDLYWGSGTPVLDYGGELVKGGSTTETFAIPEDWESVPRVSAKFSYHQSGRMHVQADGSGAARVSDIEMVPPEDIVSPVRIQTLLTKPPAQMEPYTRSLNRGGGRSIVLELPAVVWRSRQYLEFFLSPSGDFKFPRPVLKVPDDFVDRCLQPVSLGEQRDRLLVVRWFPVGTPDRDYDETLPTISITPGPTFLQSPGSVTGVATEPLPE